MKPHSIERIKIPAGFWAGLEQLGIDIHVVARRAQLPLTKLTNTIVNTDEYFAIWQAYSDLFGDTAEGIIKLATAYETAHYPPSVLATYHARDYRDALYRMARYNECVLPKACTLPRRMIAVLLNWSG